MGLSKPNGCLLFILTWWIAGHAVTVSPLSALKNFCAIHGVYFAIALRASAGTSLLFCIFVRPLFSLYLDGVSITLLSVYSFCVFSIATVPSHFFS